MEFVLDASTVVKWFLEEEFSDEALEYRKRHLAGEIVIAATPLLAFEVINALSTKSQVEEEVISSAIESFYFTQILEYPFGEELAKKSLSLCRKYKISIYDASYVALAEAFSCKFITADRKLFEKVKSLAFVELMA